ncbi:DUF1801 domain-containing protein [Lewinella sp. 4G2]|uniref:DUF1801 domain-containing protein n=1 Tax=Lewinella sp. 4G2 TaxID=1803372 RepID=UPI0018D365E2|nr:DUF1801 domain-containing protein [Lewinella sp. 4G2]
MLDQDQVLDEFYQRLPENQQVIALVLRELIHETLPEVKEKISWGSPFFNGKRNICYLWVPSKKNPNNAGELGICFNYAPDIEHGGYLDMADRTRYGCHYFNSAEEIDVEALRDILLKAWAR